MAGKRFLPRGVVLVAKVKKGKNMRNVIIAIIIALAPMAASARCLQNCTQPGQDILFNSTGYRTDSVQYREKSHNTRDVENSVMGDLNIHVGHERLEINMDKNSKSNTVDASVSSTIILGDIKQ